VASAEAYSRSTPTEAEYPPDHQAAMEVPKGGSNCAKCKFLGRDRKNCTNKFFIKWQGPDKPAGSSLIPLSIDRYCSDWFIAK
jgi:hypothetical protein